MSHSENSISEIETLRRLRRHRADRAERALREAKKAQQTLLVQIRQAQGALEQTRLEESRKSAELLSKHQGKVVSLHALKAWSSQERTLSAGTLREAGQLQALEGEQERQVIHVDNAQKHVTRCLRQVEKLKELSALLAEEVL